MSVLHSVPLRDEAKQQAAAIGQADIVVGIPSYNNARTIGHVVRAVQAGLAKYFPNHKCVLINSDGGSKDGTTEIVQQTRIDNLDTILVNHPQFPVNKIVTGYHGIPGKGSAFRALFALAARLGARACCVVDSDVRSMTPEWIELLLDPVLESGFDFVAPLYARHKFDGTITNSIVYPLTRALYGRRVRQPIGGEFGFSGCLAEHYLSKEVWDSDVARFGIDIWMTTTAIGDNFKICQSYLGAKLHDAKDPSADLTSMFTQVVGSVFMLMETHEKVWAQTNGSIAVPSFGFHYQVGVDPIRVNVDRMLENFRLGCHDLLAVWEKIFESRNLTELLLIAAADKVTFNFPDDLWVRTVYDFALAYHRRSLSTEHLLRAMKTFLHDVLWKPLQKLWENFYSTMDNLVVMALIVIIGWLAARISRWAVHGLLRLIHFDRFAYRVGFAQALARAGVHREPAAVISVAAYYFVFFVFLLLGLSALESPVIDTFITQLSTYLPRLAVALLILFGGYVVSAFVNRTVLLAAVNANVQFARGLAAAAQTLVLFFFLAVALEQAGIGQAIVVATFSILFGVVVLALAFGFGGREWARDILKRYFEKPKQKSRRWPEPEMDEISHL